MAISCFGTVIELSQALCQAGQTRQRGLRQSGSRQACRYVDPFLQAGVKSTAGNPRCIAACKKPSRKRALRKQAGGR
jgi:hypothetical protein